MPRDSNGLYGLPAGNPVGSGTLIESNWANDTMNDIGSELSDSLSRVGKGAMLASLRLIAGGAAVPGLAFADDTSLGLYFEAANRMGLVAGGNASAVLTTIGLEIVDAPTLDEHATRKDYVDSGAVYSTVLADSIDLDDVVVSGFYQIGQTPVNAPDIEAEASPMLVSQAGDVIFQQIISYTTGKLWTRAGDPAEVGGVGGWTAWALVTTLDGALGSDNTWTGHQTFKEVSETVFALTGLGVDPANGGIQYKTLTADAVMTQALTEGQSVVVAYDIVTFTLTHPAGVVWKTDDGVAPTMLGGAFYFVTYLMMNSVLYGWANGGE